MPRCHKKHGVVSLKNLPETSRCPNSKFQPCFSQPMDLYPMTRLPKSFTSTSLKIASSKVRDDNKLPKTKATLSEILQMFYPSTTFQRLQTIFFRVTIPPSNSTDLPPVPLGRLRIAAAHLWDPTRNLLPAWSIFWIHKKIEIHHFWLKPRWFFIAYCMRISHMNLLKEHNSKVW